MLLAAASTGATTATNAAGIESIENIVVIYAENRSFDNLYGSFPGANGLSPVSRLRHTRSATATARRCKELPPIWGGLTARASSRR